MYLIIYYQKIYILKTYVTFISRLDPSQTLLPYIHLLKLKFLKMQDSIYLLMIVV